MNKTEEILLEDPICGHDHLREGDLLNITIPLNSCLSGVVYIPNRKDPVDSGEKLEICQKEIEEKKPDFQIIWGIMLTKRTTEEGIRHAHDLGASFIKYIPANASTHSGSDIGIFIDEFPQFFPLFDYGFGLDMAGLIHAERMHTKKGIEIPCSYREEAAIEDVYNLTKSFPGKKIRIEHVSTRAMINFIRNTPGLRGAFAPQHAWKTFGQVYDALKNPIQENFCMPILKSPEDMQAVQREMVWGDFDKFGSSPDNAPHTWRMKLKGMPGCFLPPIVSLPLHCEIFEKMGELERLSKFLCFSERIEKFFGVRLAKRKRVVLVKEPWIVPETINGIVPFLRGEKLNWRIKEVINLQ